MQAESPPAPAWLRDPPERRLFGAVVLLVFATLFLQVHVGGAFGSLTALASERFGTRWVQAILTGGLVLGGVGLVYWAWERRRRAPDWLEPQEVPTLAGALALLALVATYWLMGRVGTVTVPEAVFDALLPPPALAFGMPALAFARLRGDRLPLQRPDPAALDPLAWAVGLGALIGLAQVLVIGLVRDPAFASVFMDGPPLRRVLLRSILPALLVGIGDALVYNAAVQEALRRHLGPAAALTAVTALVGATSVATSALVPPGDVVWQAGVIALVAVLAVLFGILTAVAARQLSRGAALEPTPTVAALSGVVAVAILGGAVAAADPGFASVLLGATSAALVAGVAGVTYDRSRTVWGPPPRPSRRSCS